jgi:hypothetical protein
MVVVEAQEQWELLGRASHLLVNLVLAAQVLATQSLAQVLLTQEVGVAEVTLQAVGRS